MAIEDHYLPEDLSDLNIELEKIHKTSMDILESATTANFINKDANLNVLKNSLEKTMILYKKKIDRDKRESRRRPIW